MQSLPYSSIVIKVGTNVLTNDAGEIDADRIKHIAEQIAQLQNTGTKVILVSSGAIGCGCALFGIRKPPTSVVERQKFAAVGQVRLVELYAEHFRTHNLACAQILLTKENFKTRDQYKNIQSCFEELLRSKIVPIVNENDVVSVKELMFTDNDEVAGLIASMMNSDALLLLTSVDGLYDGDPHDPSSNIIREVASDDMHIGEYIRKEMTKFGRGGMRAKCALAKKLSSMGIPVHIINGKRENIILKLIKGEETGTLFKPFERASGSKRWVGMCDGQEKGTVFINMGAAQALMDHTKAASLLPVGVVCILGEFRKGDIIRICDEDSVEIGMGMAQYDADTARASIGKHNAKPLVHYDYLFLGS